MTKQPLPDGLEDVARELTVAHEYLKEGLAGEVFDGLRFCRAAVPLIEWRTTAGAANAARVVLSR